MLAAKTAVDKCDMEEIKKMFFHPSNIKSVESTMASKSHIFLNTWIFRGFFIKCTQIFKLHFLIAHFLFNFFILN